MRVAVLHNTLDLQGGADAVALSVCEALRADHEVVLYTISETTPAELAPRFGLDVDVPVRTPPAGAAVARALGAAAPAVGPQLALRSALLHRWFRRHAGRHDVAVSTANEFSLPVPSVQYVHYPQFNLGALPDGEPGRLNPVWSRLAGPRPGEADDDATLIANSSWTAEVVETIYGRRPAVVHPPVDPVPDPLAWAEREDGVLTVGRIAPDKRLLRTIAVVDRVRARDHDLHLHVVGSAPRAYRRYVDRVRRAAADRAYVHLETDVSRDRLTTLLRTHKYGLNMKEREHFGMAVAEFVAAGMVAFAPDGGGQRDVLDGRSDRLFDSVAAAADLLSRAAAADEPPTLSPTRFGRDRFEAEIRRLVAGAAP